ncbi:MAG: class I SAM-dependent methyltransferase [Proteobacteria bacterium]|nr:class I SAM-dependent methyltransferase [Pseudomonadota bacterium]
MADDTLRDATIRDFGAQWTRYSENDGHYASLDMLRDILEPLLPLSQVVGKRVLEIGAGSGRIVRMLLAAGAGTVVAVEPSDAVAVLRQNTADAGSRVEIRHQRGDEISPEPPNDLIVSIGVLHHIVDPKPVVAAAHAALKPGGTLLVWLYGREGNELYLAVFGPLRALTRRLPDILLRGLCHLLTAALAGYVALARWLKLPMHVYCRNVLARYGYAHLFLTVFDQLNPAYAKYYSRAQAQALLVDAGFVRVRLHRRHGYSWTAIGERADA